MPRPLRWLLFALAIPIGVSIWLAIASVWLALGGAWYGFKAYETVSADYLSKSVATFSRSLGVASLVVRGWGTTAAVVPAMQPVANLGQDMAEVSKAGLLVAPVLPDALGENGPRRYLVCQLNDAELFGSGGAPLEATMIEFNRGSVTFPVSGAVSSKLNPHNLPYPWKIEGGLPWYPPGKEFPFANSNFHPDFGISGQNIATAWAGLDWPRVHGVLTVDLMAVSNVLRVTGPIGSEVYGEVTAENVLSKVLVESYRDYPEDDQGSIWIRKDANRQLRKDLFARVTQPGNLLGVARAVWDSLPARHIQGWASSPEISAALAEVGASGQLQTAPGDILGVFSQSAPSKLAIFASRSIKRSVVLAADGSAQVTDEVRFGNEVPKGLRGERKAYRGYLALLHRQRVAYRIPDSATDTKIEVTEGDGIVPQAKTGPYPDSAGAQVLWKGQDIPPRKFSTTKLSYRLPVGTFGTDGDLHYQLTASPQATTLVPSLQVVVTFPEGSSAKARAQDGWSVAGNVAAWTGGLDGPVSISARG